MALTATAEIPGWVDARHAHLIYAARAAFELRDAAQQSDPLRADDYDEMGELYLARALAITLEWGDW